MSSPAPHLAAVDVPIYLDNHATTQIDARVAAEVMAAMQVDFGNANSTDHAIGQTAAGLVETSRSHVAALVDADPEHVHFTSGSTEAIHLALSHAVGIGRSTPLRIGISKAEHKAVIDAALSAQRQGLATIRWVEVDGLARIDRHSLASVLASGVDLVCLMAANNEVGTTHPISELASLVHEKGGLLLVDATQGAGRVPMSATSDDIDYLVFNAHKINGPKGVGALVSAVYDSNNVYGLAAAHRPTPNVPGIVGFGEACRLLMLEGSDENARLSALRDRLEQALLQAVPDMIVNGDVSNRLPNNLHISVPGAPNDVVLSRLSRTVAMSAGSACTSGAQSPSHVLVAMSLSQPAIDSSLRISLGRQTTKAEVEIAVKRIAETINEVRAMLGNGHV